MSNEQGVSVPKKRLSKTGELAVRVTVTLPPEIVEYLKTKGKGNVSKGIRLVVEELVDLRIPF